MPLTNIGFIVPAEVRNQATDTDYILMIDANGIAYKIVKANFLQGISSGGDSSNKFDFAFSGDKHGLIYYLGTSNYTQSFINPASNGTITAISSSSLDGTNNASGIFDRGNGNSHTNRETNAWIKIDLGATRTFLLKLYAVRGRTDDSPHIPRNWKFQASNDNINWVDLDIQSNRTDFNQSTWLSFDVIDNQQAFRYFRFYQNGLNSNNDTYLTLGEMELYGSLI